MSNVREVAEGTQYQGADEELAYSVTTTPWGSTPTNYSAKAYDESVDEDVTGDVFKPNTPGKSGDVITLSRLAALEVGHSYRIEVKFTDSDSDIWELYFIVKCVT
ncbi:unnamed protein product [marine sediment metagenome]|uniref:Uncharacterized protein n=1 Tax=marine sediment metagenome TaxID=412755 RepID=X1J103_9ZZZZ